MERSKIKVGIIGCGTIGAEIAKACQGRLKDRTELVGICDTDEAKALALKKALKNKTRILKAGILIKRAELIVEAASAGALPLVMEKAIREGRDILAMSVGGLLGNERLLKKAAARGIKVYLPSGALCGIDGLKSASVGKIDSVTLVTRKPPRGLEGAPYLKERGVDLKSISEETVLFDGSAEEAVRGFPQNVNVSAVLSLAGIGAKRTRVRIVASPGSSRNIHEVEITGEAGRITARTENVPSAANPRTSALAVFSAIATLEGITGGVKIGT